MSENASISAGIAARYATAIFELAKDEKAIPAIENDVAALEAAMSDSEDFRKLVTSPIYAREESGAAITAIAAKMGLSANLTNLLGLMASKRRLFVMPQLLAVLRDLIAEEKGEVTADVVAAQALTDEQSQKLAATLKKQVGKEVKVNVAVDESLIGGLIVKVGSKMIDTSVKSKLANLQNAMKEVG